MAQKFTPSKLSEIKKLVRDKKYRINSDVLADARNHFSMDETDVLKTIKELNGQYYYKTDSHKIFNNITVDVYKIKAYRGNNIYIHFFVNHDGLLIINSFHNLN